MRPVPFDVTKISNGTARDEPPHLQKALSFRGGCAIIRAE